MRNGGQKIIYSLLMLTSCAHQQANYSYNEPVVTSYADQVTTIRNGCEAAKNLGVYKSHVDKIQNCEKPRMLDLARQHNDPNIDIVEANYAKKLPIFEKLDKKKISKAQADAEMTDINLALTDIADRRQAQAFQMLQTQEQTRLQRQQLIQQQVQPTKPIFKPYYLPMPTAPIQSQPIRQPMNCQSYRSGNQIHTNCY